MTDIRIYNDKYRLPKSWGSMTKKQLLALAKITSECSTSIEIKLKFLLFCLGARVVKTFGDRLHQIKIGSKKYILFSEEMTSLSSVFDFLFEENDNGELSLSPKLTINHFKKIRCGFTPLIGPNDALDNITYNQFVWLQTYHSRINDNSSQWIDDLINVIYLTNKGKHKPRKIKTLDNEVKTIIMWFYIGTLHFLSRIFPRVLGGTPGEIKNVFDNQQRIIDSLAEGDVTKKEKVRSSYLYDALYSMEMASLRLEEMEKKNKKNS